MSKHEESARQAVEILEKILQKNEDIIKVVEKAGKFAERTSKIENREYRTAQFIIMHYSNLCAAGGGASALTGLIPGLGTILSVFGAGAVDAFLALKFELEMSLALAHLAGYDITDPRERKIAFLLACAGLEDAYNAEKDPNIKTVIDLAVSEYSTRELSKTLTKAFARALMFVTAKKWTRLFPLVGIAIGASINKVLTTKLGHSIWNALNDRKNAIQKSEAE
ncbi:MAG: EcsC family protein [Proteobacteria bacterium]|nr:EcsC family protein [Pseudomonadota bacterium]